MQNGESSWSRREIARVFFRFQRRGIAVFVSILVLVGVTLIVSPRKYSSEARLFVRLGRESVTLDPTATTGQIISLNSSREAEINSVLEVLRSRSNIERVLDLLEPGAQNLPVEDRERAVAKLLKNINIFSPQSSNVIVLTAKASSPGLAQDTLTTLLDVCRKEHMRVNRTPGSYEFFDEQAKLLKSQLDEASNDLRDAKNKYELVTLDGRRAALEQQLSNVKTQLRDCLAAFAASDAKTKNLERSMSGLPAPLVQQHIPGVPNSAFGNMRQKLYELQSREQELLAKFTETHPDVIAIRRQVREVDQILRAETPKHDQSVTAVLASELANAASLRARAETLVEQQAELIVETKQLNETDTRVTQLERRARLLDQNYQSYVAGLEQARIDQALKVEGISNINVIQSPTFMPKATQPRKGLTMAIAFVAALLGACGTVLVSNQLDQSFKSIEEVETRLDLPILASIPHVAWAGERLPVTLKPKTRGPRGQEFAERRI